MSLFKGGLFAGALFAGALLGSDAEQNEQSSAGSGGGYARLDKISTSSAISSFFVSDPRLNARVLLNKRDDVSDRHASHAIPVIAKSIAADSIIVPILTEQPQATDRWKYSYRSKKFSTDGLRPKPAKNIAVAMPSDKQITIPSSLVEDLDEYQAMAILTILAMA